MHAPWLGARNVAFVPALDASVDINPPADFQDRVFQRVFFDQDSTGIDRSLQRYIQTVSYGRATLAASVLGTVTSPDSDTVGVGLRSLPSDHDFDAACIVVPSGGPDRGGWSWREVEPPINGIQHFARVNLEEGLGTWAMEVMHCLTEFGDLYNVSPHLNRFDNMACNCGTHPSAHTKREMQWLGPSTIVAKAGPGEASFTLHAIGLPEPAPPGRRRAVRIPAPTGNNYFMVEARLRCDQYESDTYASSGIPSEGVIVYEVAGQLEVYLRTPTALSLGESFVNSDGLEIRVTHRRVGGFSVTVNTSLGPDKREVPFVKNMRPSLAADRVRDADLQPVFTGAPETTQSFVFTQSPAPGAIVDVGSAVTMRLRKGPVP